MVNEVTRLLRAIEKGETRAAEELLPAVYGELRRLAAQKLRHERPGQTLQATDLVHEAWLRLVGPRDKGWEGRAHFFGAAAEAMRRILIDRARRKARPKHGGDLERADIDDVDLAIEPPAADILALDEALERLAREDPVKAQLVKLRYFTGLTNEQAAEMLQISRATAERHWAYARAWLFDAMKD